MNHRQVRLSHQLHWFDVYNEKTKRKTNTLSDAVKRKYQWPQSAVPKRHVLFILFVVVVVTVVVWGVQQPNHFVNREPSINRNVRVKFRNKKKKFRKNKRENQQHWNLYGVRLATMRGGRNPNTHFHFICSNEESSFVSQIDGFEIDGNVEWKEWDCGLEHTHN